MTEEEQEKAFCRNSKTAVSILKKENDTGEIIINQTSNDEASRVGGVGSCAGDLVSINSNDTAQVVSKGGAIPD